MTFSFSANLRRLRKAAGLTQEELAHACGFQGQSRIANYEASGVHGRAPSLDEIPVLAEALGVDIAELFGVEKKSNSASHAARFDPVMLAETAAAITRLYARADKVFRIEDDPERFLQAYAVREQLSDVPTSDNLIEFGVALAEIFQPQRSSGNDGRSKGVPVDGSSGEHVARRKRK